MNEKLKAQLNRVFEARDNVFATYASSYGKAVSHSRLSLWEEIESLQELVESLE